MRRLLGALDVGLVAIVAVGVFVLWPRPERITKANLERIKSGLSRAEVEAILGPPGDYTTGLVRSPSRMVVDFPRRS